MFAGKFNTNYNIEIVGREFAVVEDLTPMDKEDGIKPKVYSWTEAFVMLEESEGTFDVMYRKHKTSLDVYDFASELTVNGVTMAVTYGINKFGGRDTIFWLFDGCIWIELTEVEFCLLNIGAVGGNNRIKENC
jgi:hypothetical protein